MKISLTSLVTFIALVALLNLSGCSQAQNTPQPNAPPSNGAAIKTPTPVSMSNTNGGAVITPPARESQCGSGFTSIPEKLMVRYKNQVGDGKPGEKAYPIKHPVDFYGFIHPRDPARDQGRNTGNFDKDCAAQAYDETRVKFVRPEVNELLKMYISALIVNEKILIDSKKKIAVSGSNPESKQIIELCYEIACGTMAPNTEKQTFNIAVDNDLKGAQKTAEIMLGMSARSKIQKLSSPDNIDNYLSDTEINQMLDAALGIAIGERKK